MKPSRDTAAWARRAIRFAPRVLLVSALACQDRGAAPEQERPNFLVIDIDTFSWDHLGVVREGVSNTPRLDALAARGARFTHAFSHSGWTMPALAALLSGAPPADPHAHSSAVRWRAPDAPDLARILGLYGYRRAAFFGDTIAANVGEALAAPFDTVSRGQGDHTPATDEVVAWLTNPPATPFFVYVHDVDLHDPGTWEAGQSMSYAARYAELRAEIGDEAAKGAVTAHYDARVTRYDAAVGRMLDALEAGGHTGDTVVIVTSDHGDDFFEHAVVDHGLLYDSTIRVPLIVADPELPRRGVTVDTVVQGVDLAPTVLARAGIPVDAGMTGQPLLSLLGLAGPPYTERPVFSLTDGCHASWREGSFKLLFRSNASAHREWHPPGGENQVLVPLTDFVEDNHLEGVPLPRCGGDRRRRPGQHREAGDTTLYLELYDLVADPGEHQNLVVERPETASRLLRSLLGALEGTGAKDSATGGEPLTDTQVKTLREHGYWQFVAPDGSAPGDN